MIVSADMVSKKAVESTEKNMLMIEMLSLAMRKKISTSGNKNEVDLQMLHPAVLEKGTEGYDFVGFFYGNTIDGRITIKLTKGRWLPLQAKICITGQKGFETWLFTFEESLDIKIIGMREIQ